MLHHSDMPAIINQRATALLIVIVLQPDCRGDREKERTAAR
jgi:hypothetical protein